MQINKSSSLGADYSNEYQPNNQSVIKPNIVSVNCNYIVGLNEHSSSSMLRAWALLSAQEWHVISGDEVPYSGLNTVYF